MFPSYSLQNVLFLGDDVAVSVDPAGVVTPLKIGTSRIHVIPTQATHLYKTINVRVQAPSALPEAVKSGLTVKAEYV